MARIALCLLLAIAACTPAQAPIARRVGEVLSLAGVAGLIGTSAATHYLDNTTDDLLISCSVISAIGILTFAAGELAGPAGPRRETLPERHTRWAKILTERAAGAARDGRCPRVRRLELRVRIYDAEIHDFVFMRDPEILKCMTEPTPADP